jgi:hypothetical protein
VPQPDITVVIDGDSSSPLEAATHANVDSRRGARPDANEPAAGEAA